MLTEAHFLSVEAAKQIRPSLDAVMVSILDRSEEHDRPGHLACFRDHLMLSFEDVFEECESGFQGVVWPDQMTCEEHATVVLSKGERAPELTDAQRIVTFARKHHFCPQPIRFFVHCHGGISRSAAVAEWIAVAHCVPLPQLGDGVHTTERANKRLLRLLNKASGRH